MENSSIKERISSRISISTSQIRVGKEDDDLVCPICSNLIWEPVGCSTCKLHTCLSCIQDWLNKGKTSCPISGCKQFMDEKPHPYFFKHLSSINLECQNKERGCEQSISYEQYQKHIETECAYQEMHCQNEGCQEIVMKRDIEDHWRICLYVVVTCEYCDMQLQKKDISNHNELLCQHFPTDCLNKGCAEVVRRIDLQQHMLNCVYKLDQCTHCQILYNQTQKHNHEQKCQQRMLQCMGCQQQFKQYQLSEHTSTCNLISKKCHLCCQEYPQLEFTTLHNKEVCMELAMAKLQQDNSILKLDNAKLIQQSSLLEAKIEHIMNLCLFNHLNRHNTADLNQLNQTEQIIEQSYRQIMILFDQSQFLLHQKKKHDTEFIDVHQTLKHFQFLTNTSILYAGWHKLHCSDCMSSVKKITPLIQPFLDTIKNIEESIAKNKQSIYRI